MSRITPTQLKIGSSASISPYAGVPPSALHQASSSKSVQPFLGSIVKEVTPSYHSHHAIAVGSDLEEGQVASIVSSQSSEHIVFDEGLQNQHPSLRDFVGDTGKVWGNSKDWVLELRDGRQIVIPLSLYPKYGFCSW